MRREDEYTKPHNGCRNPGLWTAADAYSAECEVTELVAAFVRATQPEYCVETGTCFGQTAEAIGNALKANGHGHLVTLEVDADKVAMARQRCTHLPVTVLHLSSDAFEPAEPIGFAWFDSLLDLRVSEFRRYKPWLHPGAVVGFHDTHHGNLWGEIDRLVSERLLRPMFLPTPRGVCFAEVL